MAKTKSKQFDSCVQQVEEGGGSVNPFAVCAASMTQAGIPIFSGVDSGSNFDSVYDETMANLFGDGVKITRKQMAAICPDCAEEMRSKNFTEITMTAGVRKKMAQRRSVPTRAEDYAVARKIWRESPDHVRAHFGNGPQGRSRKQKPPKKWMDACLRRVKVSRLRSEKRSEVKPDIPGGDFDAKRNPNGTWDIYDVDIFAEHTINLGGKRFRVGKKFMVRAMHKAERRYKEDKYLPPLHIHHHMTEKRTGRAGFFKFRAVRKARYEGKMLWVTFVDLIQVPDKIYQKIRAGELTYRSVEIHDFSRPEIDSLALLDDEVPFFRLQNLTIGEEKKVPQGRIEKPHRFSAKAKTPVVMYQAIGSRRVHVLYKSIKGAA